MSCAGYFERLLRIEQEIEEQSFAKKAVQEIDERKTQLKRELQSLRVKGDFHKATQIQAKLEKLDKTKERIKQLLEG